MFGLKVFFSVSRRAGWSGGGNQPEQPDVLMDERVPPALGIKYFI